MHNFSAVGVVHLVVVSSFWRIRILKHFETFLVKYIKACHTGSIKVKFHKTRTANLIICCFWCVPLSIFWEIIVSPPEIFQLDLVPKVKFVFLVVFRLSCSFPWVDSCNLESGPGGEVSGLTPLRQMLQNGDNANPNRGTHLILILHLLYLCLHLHLDLFVLIFVFYMYL